MELIRKILFTIENQYVDVVIYNLRIEGYDLKTIAYHCGILDQTGLISDYRGDYGDGELMSFSVGSLTWEGHNYLDKIRDGKMWKRIKTVIKEEGIPFTIDVVKKVSTAIISNIIKNAII